MQFERAGLRLITLCQRRARLAAGFACALLAPLGHTQEVHSVFNMELSELLELRVVTAAAGYEQNPKEAPAAVTVIDAEEWRAVGATTLMEAISRTAGIHVSMTRVGIGYEKPVIRGFSGTFGQQILLMIDGVPFRSAREGGAPWAELPLTSFKRIEVIRGSGSAIYGADAVGGIINLISYAPGTAPKQLTLAAGQYDYRNLALTTSGAKGEHHWNVALSTQQADNHPDRIIEQDLQSLYDDAAGTQASLAPGEMDTGYEVYTIHAQWQYKNFSTAYFEWGAPDYVTGAGVAQALDDQGNVRLRTQSLDAIYDASQHVLGDMDLRLTWRKFNIEADTVLFPAGTQVLLDPSGNIQPPALLGVVPGLRWVSFPDGVIGQPDSTSHSVTLELNHVLQVHPHHKLRWAIGTEHSDIRTSESKNFGPGVYDGVATTVDGTLTEVSGSEFIYLPDEDRTASYISVQDEWQLHPDWLATLGVRYDYYSDFGATTNPRLGLVWRPDPSWTFKAYTGTAFRAPSFVELYSKNNPTARGNPDLKPESISMLDSGVSASGVITENLEASLNLFHYTAKDLITYMPVDAALIATNAGQVKMRGLEYQMHWQATELARVSWNLTALDPYDAVGVDTSAIARLSSNLDLHLLFEPLHVFAGIKWAGNRERSGTDPRPAIDDNVSVDSTVQYKHNDWSLSMIAENLFDADIREPSTGVVVNDYPMARRNVKLLWRYQF